MPHATCRPHGDLEVCRLTFSLSLAAAFSPAVQQAAADGGPSPATPWRAHDNHCYVCGEGSASFTLLARRRRHHCRKCGHSCCDAHCAARVPLPELAVAGGWPASEAQRVCVDCHSQFDAAFAAALAAGEADADAR